MSFMLAIYQSYGSDLMSYFNRPTSETTCYRIILHDQT